MSRATPRVPHQPLLNTHEQVVVALLTENRLNPYIMSCNGNMKDALQLYKWNIRASAACFTSIAILEVFVRNAFDRQLQDWAVGLGSPSWLDVIPVDRRGKSDIHRARIRATRSGTGEIVHGKVVAELGFGFWRYLASRRYLTSLWIPSLGAAFPYGDPNMARRRQEVESILARLVLLRNRVAHHEPVFKRDLSKDYSNAIQLLGWVHPDSAQWLRSVSTLRRTIASRPQSIRHE